MDSLSQLALGSAVGIAVMGRRTAWWKAALWGGVCGTLPDLDTFIDHGDPISNMSLHRTESHALFYLSAVSAPLAAGVARLHGESDQWRRWWFALWLALVTHPLLDLMTVYGTQLGLPITDHPYAVGSVFIIDPLYTLPLVAGVAAALWRRDDRGARWNAAGLALSTGYLLWSVLAQQFVTREARESLAAQGAASDRLLVTPAPFSTVLWRIVSVGPDGYREGYYSLLDGGRPIDFALFPRGQALYHSLRGDPHVDRLAWFSRGFYKLEASGDRVLMSDLRMGLEPHYTFTFEVARMREGVIASPVPPRQLALETRDLSATLRWLAKRLRGDDLPPPAGSPPRGAS